MSKVIALYEGGIHERVQVAVREDGVLFQRYQERTRLGIRWVKWRYANKIPNFEQGMELPSEIRGCVKSDGYGRKNFGVRLPAGA